MSSCKIKLVSYSYTCSIRDLNFAGKEYYKYFI